MRRTLFAFLIGAVLMLLSQLSALTTSKGEALNTVRGANPIQGSPCFNVDPGIGNPNRDDHSRWAQQQDSTKLMNNLVWKIGILFNCNAVSGDQLAKGFGEMSGIIGDYVSDPACFNNVSSVTGRDRAAHEQWARTKSREEVRDNLQWKAVAAMKCLNRDAQVAFFADESAALARIPSGNSGGVSNGGSLGCFKDSSDRDLAADSFQSDQMTTERCVAYCKGKGYAYAGTQYSTQCFCGNSYGKYGPANANECNMKCIGDSGQICGGFWVISVYPTK